MIVDDIASAINTEDKDTMPLKNSLKTPMAINSHNATSAMTVKRFDMYFEKLAILDNVKPSCDK